jgi:restriction system protein
MTMKVNLMPPAQDLFGTLIEQMWADIRAVRRQAAELLQAGDYAKARAYLDRAELMEPLVRNARALRDQWQAAMTGQIRGRRPGTVRRPRTGAGTSPGGRMMPPQKTIWAAILQALEDAGGRAAANDVVDRVGQLIGHLFPPAAHERDAHGCVRWRHRVHWERFRLVERGLLSSTSPYGVWEISEEGRQWLGDNPLNAKVEPAP